ncbi:HAD-IIIA family hydrolase [Alphaproteobacteria bacterium]|nr:HAD-IIIA family hydrolase [Alphaproteobacteria bacterium]
MKQGVVLAGGKGTRLKEVSGDLPKPMVPLLGKPLLQHLIEKCVVNGITDIKLLISYKKEVIEDYFGDGDQYGATIQYIVEDTLRGTAGALIDALPELDEQFLVVYGDTFFDIDLDSFWLFHQNQAGDASIFLHPNDHPYDSDLVEVNSDFRVKKIHTYPHNMQWRQNLVNAAVYIFNKDALQSVNLISDRPDIAKDLFPLMLESKKKLYGYISTEYIKDMGTPERLLKVENDINSGRVKSLKKQTPKMAIFLDRDGTINKEVNHLSNQDQFELIDGVGEAIRQINMAGILAIVVTNQPVIARGELKESDLKVIHNKMDTLLGMQGAYLDRLYYCPHHTDSGFEGEIETLKFDCDCRKPQIGLFMKAKKDLNIILEKSWVIGDSTRDILAAQNAGMKSVLVFTGHAGKDYSYEVTPDLVSKDLSEAVKLILKEIE